MNKNKIRGINTYTLPVIRYPAGIPTDIKTRKLFTMHADFHPKSSTPRPYAKRKEG